MSRGRRRMGFIWNHWFWITLGLGLVVNISAESLLENNQDGEESLFITPPAGARGGKILRIPDLEPYPEQNPFLKHETNKDGWKGPSVSVSKSVSKVSVKMGDVSEAGVKSLEKISEIYVDQGISNKVEINRPQARRIDPQFISYNLVYRDPPERKPEPKPPGLLQTIIDKLKSLARATTSRIRLSSILLGGDGFSSPEQVSAPESIQPAPGQISTSSIHPVIPNRNPEQDNLSIRIDDLRVSAGELNPVDGSERTDQINETDEEEPSSRIDIKPVSETVTGEERPRPRSMEARGRSLPLHVLEDLEIQKLERRLRLKADTAERVMIKEIQGAEWEAEELESMVEDGGEPEQDEERMEEDGERVRSQGDFNADFSADTSYTPDSGDLRIEVERMDANNISAIVGVVVGIVIFIIISIVLVLLGVQRTRTRKDERSDDVISQASYMTYSTTVSDTSVNYGPNWDKDMIEDLCSLDNDSFLNSLEAVTTTDYWGEPKY